ncbi:MAG: sulfite exporter TauE/SafE family protein [Moraxellaceae bacterium]|nr:sulfite exporter TauE/SafE family protein [Pseudobdellovibrionaceae bacterium]
MTEHHETYFLILAFFSELIGTLSGVSSSTLFIPLGKLFESIQVTLALTALLHVMGNSVRTIMYWKNINWPLTLKFGIPSIIMSGLGAHYSDLFSAQVFSIALGLFLIGISSYFHFFKTKFIFAGTWLPYLGGGLSGLLTGLIGSGGAVRSLALTAFDLNPLTFTATSTLIDFGGDIFRFFIYLQKGYLTSAHYFYFPFLLMIALGANWLARIWIKRIPKERFEKIVLIFVFIMGFVSIGTSFF